MTISSPSPVIPGSSPEAPERSGRRPFLRRLTGLGAGVVGAIAWTFADAPAASAVDTGCCVLAKTNPCGGSWNNDGHFTCPSGYYKHYWPCCCGYFIYHCWECTNGSTCDNGSRYYCSNYWNYYLGGCCQSGCGCPKVG